MPRVVGVCLNRVGYFLLSWPGGVQIKPTYLVGKPSLAHDRVVSSQVDFRDMTFSSGFSWRTSTVAAAAQPIIAHSLIHSTRSVGCKSFVLCSSNVVPPEQIPILGMA